MQYDTTLTESQLHDTLTELRPDWQLREAQPCPSQAGHHAVYRLDVDTPAGRRACYLKATPPEKDATLGLAARVLAVVDATTDLPVSTVHGLLESAAPTDGEDGLSTPAVLLEALPGKAIGRADPSVLSPDEHEGVARQVGRSLADLHAVDAVDAFGFLRSDGPTCRGRPPDGDPDHLTVADPTADWRPLVREWADREVDALRDSRFADVASTLGTAIHGRIDALDGPFEPALARIDQSLENLLVADGEVTGLIDWEFTMAVTPAYDAVHVAASLTGGPFVFAPSVADRRDRVFDALVDGYRDRAPETADRIERHREAYDLLFAVRAMANLRAWFGMLDLGAEVDATAAALRREVRR